MITSRSATHATVDIVEKRARRTGAEERGGSPLLFDDAVVVGGCGGGDVDRGQGTGAALDELDELVVVALNPLRAERASEGRPKCEGLADRVHVEDGGTR